MSLHSVPQALEPTPQPRLGWVLYDADCAVCTRLARFWDPTLSRLGLSTAPLQSPWAPGRTGLSEEDLRKDIRLLQPDGKVISGPDVYRYVMRRLWWAYPLYFLSLAPGLSHVFDWTYRTFAGNRRMISPRCDVPPR
jgi:predicted DCC family thiol-disulfide oxidoreductase YuxK